MRRLEIEQFCHEGIARLTAHKRNIVVRKRSRYTLLRQLPMKNGVTRQILEPDVSSTAAVRLAALTGSLLYSGMMSMKCHRNHKIQ